MLENDLQSVLAHKTDDSSNASVYWTLYRKNKESGMVQWYTDEKWNNGWTTEWQSRIRFPSLAAAKAYQWRCSDSPVPQSTFHVVKVTVNRHSKLP
jgi:hypothetical protein